MLLENSAGSGDTLGSRFSQIGDLFDRLDRHARLGVCLDTAHTFASGYDLRTDEGIATTLEEIDRTIGVDRVRLIHANDSKGALGSHLDRHENIGKGFIGDDAFRRILTHPGLRGKPFILETPVEDDAMGKADIAALKRLSEQ